MITAIRVLLISMLFICRNVYSFEITPVYGFSGGGSFIDKATDKKHVVANSNTMGLIIGVPYETDTQLELYYGRQESDIDSVDVTIKTSTNNVDIPLSIDFIHLGGTTPLADYELVEAFLSGGLGFSYLSPDIIGLQPDLRASFNIGVGVKWPFAEQIGLRLEVRTVGILFDNSTVLFCDDNCSLSVRGNLFLQVEALAGLTIRF